MILYKLNNNNRTSWWKIEQSGPSYTITWGQDTATMHLSTENHNSYTTDSPERAAAEVESRVNEQINRRGYSVDKPTSIPDLPMLAQQWTDHLKKGREPFLASLQPKIDGERCIATNNKLITRTNERITSCPHITYLLEHLSEEFKLDGELYIPRTDLQTVQSIVSRQLPHKLHKQVEYHVFDLVDTELPFKDRYEQLITIINTLQVIHSDLYSLYTSVPEKLRSKSHLTPDFPIKLVPTEHLPFTTHSPEFLPHIKGYHSQCVEAGYEGAIIRNTDSPYELNYRSPNLLKYKARLDAEFKCIDVSEGYDKTGIFVCQTESGVIFEATPAWTTRHKQHLLINKDKYIGRYVTVEYERLSRDGSPLKPTAKATRNVVPEA